MANENNQPANQQAGAQPGGNPPPKKSEGGSPGSQGSAQPPVKSEPTTPIQPTAKPAQLTPKPVQPLTPKQSTPTQPHAAKPVQAPSKPITLGQTPPAKAATSAQTPSVGAGQPPAKPSAPSQASPVKPVQPLTAGPQPAKPIAPGQAPTANLAKPPTKPVPAQAPAGKPGQPTAKPGATRKPPNPKKLIFGCIGCSGAVLLFFIIFVLIFVSQTSSTGENPIARSLGVSTGVFINTLIQLVNLIFGTITILLFVLAIIGLFRFFMARKDDKAARKKGVTMAGVSGLLLFIFIFMWVGIYMYMSSNRVPIEAAPATGIITEPEETLRLTAPITVVFDASTVPINTRRYEILSYLWDFGDGTTSTTQITSHEYTEMGANQGRFDVKLQITARDINTGEEIIETYSKTVTIANIALSARFTADPETGPAPLEVKFDASDSAAPAGEIVDYEWDFDNNNVFDDGSGVEATYTFEQVGTYKVNLRVTDNVGNFEVSSQDIVIEGANIPTADIEVETTDGNFYIGRQYTFSGEDSTSPNGKITKYEWDFGDETPKATTRTATHIYKTEGEYEVILTVTDEENKEGETSQKIKLEVPEAAPIAIIKTVPAPEADADYISNSIPFEVSFDGGDSTDADNNIVDYKWDFDGDGSIDDSGETVTYSYNQAGTYNATLTVIDAEDNESSSIIVIRVGEQPLTAKVIAEPVEGITPLTVTFDASSSSYPSGEIVSYEWEFGDGTPKRIDVSKVIYKYSKIGTFTTTVTAKASDGTSDDAEITINVRPIPLTACFEASPESGEAPITVEFDPRCSSGTIAKYSWDFGDGESSKTRKPTHEYDNPGNYTVTLEIADNQNVLNTFTKNILVTGSI